MMTQNLRDSAKAVLREKFIVPSYKFIYFSCFIPQETRKALNRQPNSTSKAAGKRTRNHKLIKRKEIIKIRAEINDKKMKETSKS